MISSLKAAALGLLMIAAPAPAATPDEQAAVAAAEALLAALSDGDGARMAALTVPEGWATATGVRDGKPFLRRQSWTDFIGRQKPGGPKLNEYMTGHEVRTDGDIAMVWGPYVLNVDGKFQHCGVDHFDLVRQDGAWKVLNVTWSQRTEGCGR